MNHKPSGLVRGRSREAVEVSAFADLIIALLVAGQTCEQGNVIILNLNLMRVALVFKREDALLQCAFDFAKAIAKHRSRDDRSGTLLSEPQLGQERDDVSAGKEDVHDPLGRVSLV